MANLCDSTQLYIKKFSELKNVYYKDGVKSTRDKTGIALHV